MQLNHSAFNGDTEPNTQPPFNVVIDYPKSEPVLESSYVFPKADCYDVWKFNTNGTFTVSENI